MGNVNKESPLRDTALEFIVQPVNIGEWKTSVESGQTTANIMLRKIRKKTCCTTEPSIHPSIHRTMGSVPVGVNHAFHKLPPRLRENSCCRVHVNLAPFLIGSSSDSRSIYHAKYDLFFSALSCSFGIYIQLYFTRLVVNKQTSKLKHRITKSTDNKLVNAAR